MANKKLLTKEWFSDLRDQICSAFESLEIEYSIAKSLPAGKFIRTPWARPSGGGGEISLMRGNLFEKVGVNISTVYGNLSPEFAAQIPGTEGSREFFATGVSVVVHLSSPLVPAAHFNTRYIETSYGWFGGGGDLTPFYPDEVETAKFHSAFKGACDKYNPNYYPKFKQNCDEYFYLQHRKEPRGVGGIFYDYLKDGEFENNFSFTKDVGKAFLEVYPKIIRNKMLLPWTRDQRDYQLLRRGRYVEFNLLYDRGTKFGLMTDGNIEAILMSLPPEVRW